MPNPVAALPASWAGAVARATHRALPGLWLCAALGPLAASVAAAPGAEEPWRTEIGADGSAPGPRHEAGAVEVGDRMYLLGGRALGTAQTVDAYDPVARTWTAVGRMPIELHHFQPVAVGTEIWIVGAFTGGYPDETPVPDVYAYDTLGGTWRVAGRVPEARRRGSAGAALHDDGLIYVLGGNTRGHDGGAVAWLDRFDPLTGVWEALPDAAHPRDHFGVAILGDVLVSAGGRATALPDPFAHTVAATETYSIPDGTWSTADDIPTPRAGAFTAGAGTEMIVVGGEVTGRDDALAVAEAFDANRGTWRALRPLNAGRHSGGAAVLGDRLHLAAGSDTKGGSNTQAHESLGLDTGGPGPFVDTDGDGLSDEAEVGLGTDPAVADTDGDAMDDGEELAAGTDPLAFDTDGDGAGDGAERSAGTDPLVATGVGAGTRGGGGGGGASDALGLALAAIALALRRRRRIGDGRGRSRRR